MKKLLSLLLALSLMLTGALALTSCGETQPPVDPDPQPPTSYNEDYVVLAIDQHGSVVTGLKIGVAPADDLQSPAALPTATNSKGLVSFNLDNSKTYKAILFGTLSGYQFTSGSTVSFGENKVAVVTVQKDEEPTYKSYTIIVLDQNGAPVEGASVQACIVGGSCYSFGATGAGGSSVAQIEDDGAERKAQVTGVPSGYTYSSDYVSFDNNGVAIIYVVNN